MKYDNVHFLAALAGASSTLNVVATENILDTTGATLLAKDQALTAEIQQRLAARNLAKPLEASVCVEGGVTVHEIEQTVVRLCHDSAFLAAVVGRDFIPLRQLYHSISLHPFVHMMLSVQRAARPELFSHSVLCSLLAGALALKDGGPIVNAKLALLAGLMHDFGEMYWSPDTRTHIAGDNRDRWQEIVAHAEAGQFLGSEFADCPESISQAVYEHHEKLDGSGYPRGIAGQELSYLGRVLSLAETVCGVIKAPDNHGARVKLAVSFVPGEFDPQLANLLTASISGTPAAEIALSPSFDVAHALARARLMNKCLDDAQMHIEPLGRARLDPQMAEVVAFAYNRIGKLKSSWESTGIGECFSAEAVQPGRFQENEGAYFELTVVSRELIWRMRSLARQLQLLLRQRRLAGYGALESVISALEVVES